MDITKTGAQTHNEITEQIDENFHVLPERRRRTNADTYSVLFEPRHTTLQALGISPDFGESTYDVTENASWEDLYNYEDLRGERQPWIAKLGAGVTKGAILAGTTVIDGTLGFVYGLGAAAIEGRVSAIFDNDISNAMHAVNEWSEKVLPNYRTEAEKNAEWYQNLGTVNFWADSFLKNMGFTVGAMIGGGIWTLPLKALKVGAVAARLIGSAFQGINEGRIEANNLYHENLDAANKVAKEQYDNYVRDIIDNPELSASAKMQLINDAKNNLQEVYQINRDQALKAGVIDLAVNSVLLPASDYFTYGRLYTRGFKNAQKQNLKSHLKLRAENIIKDEEGKLGSIVVDAGGRYAVKNGNAVVKGAAKGLGKGTVEMNEEMWQEMAAQTATSIYMPDSPDAYYEAMTDPEALKQSNDFWESIGKGFAKSYGDGAQWEQGFVGFLTGVLGVPTAGRMNNMGHDVAIGRGMPVAISGGLLGEINQARYEREQAEKYVPLMNNLVDKLQKNRDYLAQSNAFQDAMDGFSKTNNQFEYENASDNDIFASISAFAQTGRMNDLKALLNEDFENMSQEDLQKIAIYTAKNPVIDDEGNVLRTDTTGNILSGPYVKEDGTLYTATEEGTEEMRKSLINQRDNILEKVEKYEESQTMVRALGHDALNEDQVNELAWYHWKIGVLEDRFSGLKAGRGEFFDNLSNSLENFITEQQADDLVSEEEMIESPGRKEDETLEEYKERLRLRDKTRKHATLDLETEEGKTLLHNLQAIKELLDYVRSAKSALELGSIIKNNPELINYMTNDLIGNAQLESIAGADHAEFLNSMKHLEDLGHIARAAEKFNSRYKEFSENPINLIKNRSKIRAKVEEKIKDAKDKRTKKQADSIARRIDFGGTPDSIAKALDDNAKDIESVGGLDAWLENLTDEQKDKVRKAQIFRKSIASLKDRVSNSEDINEDRIIRAANLLIDDAAKEAKDLEDLQRRANALLNSESLDDKIKRQADAISKNDYKMEQIIADTKTALKTVFDDSFDKIKRDADALTKLEEANRKREEEIKKQADKIKEKESKEPELKVPKEPKEPKEPELKVPKEKTNEEPKDLKVPKEKKVDEDLKVPKEPVDGKRMKGFNDKVSGTIEQTNSKEYNRPQVSEVYFHGLDRETYLEYIQKHKEAVPRLNEFDMQAYLNAETAIYNYLKKEKAFEYVKEHLKVGDNIEFFVDEDLNAEAETFVVLMRVRDAEDKPHVIGSMPTEINFASQSKSPLRDDEGDVIEPVTYVADLKTLAELNPDRYALFNAIKKAYEESEDKSKDVTFFESKVDKLMGGSLPLSNKESSVSSIFEGTGHTPIIAIADQSGSITSGNENIDSHILGRNFQTEGQVYILIRSNNGSYVPALTYSVPLIDLVQNASNNSDDWYINQIIDKLQKATKELNTPGSAYKEELYKWLMLPGLSVGLKYRDGNKWVSDTSVGIEKATHLVLDFDDDNGEHKTITIPLTNKEITREDTLTKLKEALKLSKKTTTNVIIGQLKGPNKEDYIKNISRYLITNIIVGETHTINDWFTYEYAGDKPNLKIIKKEERRLEGKIGSTKDPVTIYVNDKKYNIEGENVYREDGTLVDQGSQEYEEVMHPTPPNTDKKEETKPKEPEQKEEESKTGLNIVNDLFEGTQKQDKASDSSTTSDSERPRAKRKIINGKTRKFLRTEDTEDSASTQEQIQKDIDKVKNLFPKLAQEGRIRLVNGLIKTIDEKGNPIEAYGEFKDGVLYISNVSPKGTAFHESFHYIVDMLLNSNEVNEMFKAAELRFKTTERMELEEKLAEQFRDYMNGMNDNSIKGIIKRIFEQLKHIINNIKGKPNYLDNLFYSIYRKRIGLRKENKSSGVSKFMKKEEPTRYNKMGFEMLIGIPGSGKSTYIKTINNPNVVVVNLDDIRKELTGNISDQSKNGEVWNVGKSRIQQALKDGKYVILDATNVNTVLRRGTLDEIKKQFKGINTYATVFDANPEVSKQRIKNDIDNNVDRSKVPDEIIDKMYSSYLESMNSLEPEGFTEIYDGLHQEYSSEMSSIKRKAIANGTFMKAPNDKPTNLNERQWLQVRTKAFKRWFGDWAKITFDKDGKILNIPDDVSKVVDENGEPLVVYHGSDQKGITTFDNTKSSTRIDTTPMGVTYWTNHKGVAKEYMLDAVQSRKYKGGQVNEYYDENDIYSAFLNLKNPKIVNYQGRAFTGEGIVGYWYDALDDTFVKIEDSVFANELELIDYLRKNNLVKGKIEPNVDYKFESAEQLPTTDETVSTAREENFDGVILLNVNELGKVAADDYITFNPNQIELIDSSESDLSNEDNKDNEGSVDFKEELLDYRYRKTDYSNLDQSTKDYLTARKITEEAYQALSAEQREYLLHCI